MRFLSSDATKATRFGRDDMRLLQETGGIARARAAQFGTVRSDGTCESRAARVERIQRRFACDAGPRFQGPAYRHSWATANCSLELGDQYREEIETVYAQTRRLVRLSEDALVLAQTQAEGFSLARTIVDLGRFVADCVETTAPNNPRLVVEVPPETAAGRAGPAPFPARARQPCLECAQVLERPSDAFACGPTSTAAIIEVSDRGIGIPEGELASLFTRFGRASNARDKGITGSGIGLYVARKIVDVHRGSISVRSKENEGSTFIVTLPLADFSRQG